MVHSSPFATTSNPLAKWLQSVAKVLPCKLSAWLGSPPLQGTRRFNYLLIFHPARKTLPHCTGPKEKEAPEEGGDFKGMTITELTQRQPFRCKQWSSSWKEASGLCMGPLSAFLHNWTDYFTQATEDNLPRLQRAETEQARRGVRDGMAENSF